MGSVRARRSGSCLALAWLWVACAQDVGFLAEGWAGAPGVQRVLVLPTSFDDPPPNFLAAGTERVTDALEERIRASGRAGERISTSEALETGREVVRDLDLRVPYDPAEARPHLAAIVGNRVQIRIVQRQ
jgi:hypothetical protein